MNSPVVEEFDYHPFLLTFLDLGAHNVSLEAKVSTLKKSGKRILHLRLWCHTDERVFHPKLFDSRLMDGLANALSCLTQLSLVGHARPIYFSCQENKGDARFSIFERVWQIVARKS